MGPYHRRDAEKQFRPTQGTSQEDIASPWLSFSPAPQGVESKDTDPGCSNAQLARHCQLGTLDRPEIYI